MEIARENCRAPIHPPVILPTIEDDMSNALGLNRPGYYRCKTTRHRAKLCYPVARTASMPRRNRNAGTVAELDGYPGRYLSIFRSVGRWGSFPIVPIFSTYRVKELPRITFLYYPHLPHLSPLTYFSFLELNEMSPAPLRWGCPHRKC